LTSKLNDQGFTLVEMIVVIVILGILSATVLPKFIALKDEAILAKLTAMDTALRSGANLVYDKAYLAKQISGLTSLDFEGETIEIYDGFPTAKWNGGIGEAVSIGLANWKSGDNICDTDWCYSGYVNSIPSGVSVGSGRAAKVWPKSYTFNQQCGVYYINRLDGLQPTVGLETADC